MRGMIIDSHTHVYPEKIARKVLPDIARRAAIPCFSDGTIGGLRSSMKQAGIQVSVISRIATRAEQVEGVNHWLQGQIRQGIVALATFHPDMQWSPGFVREIKQRGFKGFKLHPDYQGFFVDDRRMYPFYETAQAESMPVLTHAGLDRGLPPPLRATPERIAKVHSDFPALDLIAAHMGGEDNYDQTEAFLLGKPIYLDTSFVLKSIPANTLERFFGRHPIERFLFGTDSPFRDQTEELNFVLDLSFLTQASKDKVLGENAAGLLRV